MTASTARDRLARFAAGMALVIVGGLVPCRPASAHDARPLSIEIIEQSVGLYRARMRAPPTVALDNRPTIHWPGNCRVLSDRLRPDPDVPDETMFLRCTGGLEGEPISVRYPIYNPSLSTLFRLSKRDGSVLTRVLTPDQLIWRVPKQPGWREVAPGYVELGIRHIWTGIDHLLFVAGLLVLAGTFRRVLLAITGFTLAHSVTLSLSALGLVQLPEPPVEAAIALSILFLAREIARPSPDGLAARYPILVASSFGLLHGFGFAAALREVGLPPSELALGLFCFNLGVEIGQIAFIAAVAAAVMGVRKLARRSALVLEPRDWGPSVLWGYALGIPAAFWFIQRLAAFPGP